MRRAVSGDVSVLVDLMADFYAESGYALNRDHASQAFQAILDDERLGRIWLIEADRRAVGHVVLTLKYAMEYGGTLACVDDLYVRPEWRNRGLSTRALQEVRAFCETAGVRAMTVEVAYDNQPAQKVYRRIGFGEAVNRQLLALPLAAPSHEE